MDRLDSGVVTWDIEDWDKSASDHKDLPQRGSLIGVHQRATIISGEARTLMLESLAQVSLNAILIAMIIMLTLGIF